MKRNKTIFSTYKKAEKLIKLLNLSDYIDRYDAFSVKVFNRTIILYDDKSDKE